MPRYQRPRDWQEEVNERLAQLENTVRLLSANPNPSLPIYTGGDDPDDMYDGMVWLQSAGAEQSFNYRLSDSTLTLQGS